MPYEETPFVRLFDNAHGALLIGVNTVLSPLLRGGYNCWGATAAEVQRTLPGDEMLPHPRQAYTRAVTINAPPEQVWPWIAQIGQGRAALYSYELLENIARCDMHNLNHIDSALQNIQAGDLVRLGPEGYPVYKVHTVEAGHHLLLVGADPKTGAVPDMAQRPAEYMFSTWLFYLEPAAPGQTRLLMRGLLDYMPPSFMNRTIWNLTEPIGFVMMRRMLIGIKQRAEAH
jgi:hypothetical protein